MSSSFYLRIKRKKTTAFVTVAATDTILDVKHKVAELLQQVNPL